jgi:uncharacterized protein YndB with AHSA1/START domain
MKHSVETENLIAKAHIDIAAPLEAVWDALLNPQKIKKYFFNANVSGDWTTGGKIFWKGEWNGMTYDDKGEILQLKPYTTFQFTHYSPLGGLPDTPGNYHTVTIELIQKGDNTHVTLLQDNNASDEQVSQSEANWKEMLEGLKKVVEEK